MLGLNQDTDNTESSLSLSDFNEDETSQKSKQLGFSMDRSEQPMKAMRFDDNQSSRRRQVGYDSKDVFTPTSTSFGGEKPQET